MIFIAFFYDRGVKSQFLETNYMGSTSSGTQPTHTKLLPDRNVQMVKIKWCAGSYFTWLSFFYDDDSTLWFAKNAGSTGGCSEVNVPSNAVFTSACYTYNANGHLKPRIRFYYNGGSLVVGSSSPGDTCRSVSIDGPIQGIVFQEDDTSMKWLKFLIACPYSDDTSIYAGPVYG